MCGIAGVAFRTCPPHAMRSALAAMRQRGPDGEGVWRQAEVVLGHRRLRVIDPSPSADQPLVGRHGDVAVVFNGEIYNHRVLRRDLAARGHRFRTGTDGEVLLHGYQQWDMPGLLERLDGMFAFALWDGAGHRLLLARDRFGKKPLFYSQLGGGLAFASTLTALLQLLPVTPGFHAPAIADFLTWMAVPPPQTVYEGCLAVPPAHWASLRVGGALATARFDELPAADTRGLKPAEVLARLDTLLDQAVAKRLEADVPLGAFLSGGIDSGLVVAKAAQSLRRRLTTVTIGFPGSARDERALARLTAERYGTEHYEETVGPETLDQVPEVQKAFGQPFADPSALPTFAVARAARRHLTVALNGDGGDELFCGYARPVLAKAAERYGQVVPLWARRRLLARQASPWARAAQNPLRRNLGRLLEAGRGDALCALRPTRGLAGMLATCCQEAFLARLGSYDSEALLAPYLQMSGDWAGRVLAADIWTYLSPQLLTKMDVSTMAVGLEARSPLLDWELARFAASLPTAIKLPGFATKHLLRQLARRDLPAALVERHKTGFAPPVAAWLRGRAAESWRQRLRDQEAPVWRFLRPEVVTRLWDLHCRGQDWSDALYTVFCLDAWLEGLRDRRELAREVVS